VIAVDMKKHRKGIQEDYSRLGEIYSAYIFALAQIKTEPAVQRV